VIVMVLGWPFLLAGAAIGALAGWRAALRWWPWFGAVIGAIVGVIAGAIAFLAYSAVWID
jgi:hypothetical protein